MGGFDPERLRIYLSGLLGTPVRVDSVAPLSGTAQGKGYGYGVPLEIRYTADGRERRAVLETTAPGPFGHEHLSDR
ncbi:MAG TPA: aminoglycoside phosphotransferase family protein, partial [Planctomycetota bacterium]|nr:aminoglycoside phosphotransferase family protein [Planctomycetota bacterium]